MQFISYTKSDTAYTFIGKDGEKLIVPIGDVILVDDNSGAIAVKNTASRCVLGYVFSYSSEVFLHYFSLFLNLQFSEEV